MVEASPPSSPPRGHLRSRRWGCSRGRRSHRRSACRRRCPSPRRPSPRLPPAGSSTERCRRGHRFPSSGGGKQSLPSPPTPACKSCRPSCRRNGRPGCRRCSTGRLCTTGCKRPPPRSLSPPSPVAALATTGKAASTAAALPTSPTRARSSWATTGATAGRGWRMSTSWSSSGGRTPLSSSRVPSSTVPSRRSSSRATSSRRF
mmetsp:Transcript_1916/g.4781  ORF Transcript_1916/g.4781 Transcript_1916/m.4781 type:complete len:203 (-) Transcript_1916:1087-1695(-)